MTKTDTYVESTILTPTEEPKKGFFSRHSSYFETIKNICFFIGYVYGGLSFLYQVFTSIKYGDFFSFVLAIIFGFFIQAFWGLIAGVVSFVVLILVTFIPYLIIRGLSK